jgi:glucokinase
VDRATRIDPVRDVMDNDPGWILGLDIGGTKTTVLAGSATGDVFERRRLASDAQAGFDRMWAHITAAADELVALRGRPTAVGVSIGGPLDHRRGIVYSPPNLPGWDRIRLKDRLSDRFGAPTFVEHDAKAGLLAEWYFGAARGHRNVVFLTVGTGLGCGLLLDGHLYRGASDRSGEIGHWRMAMRGPAAYGKRGSWEAFSSGAGLPRLARHLYPKRDWSGSMTAEELVAMARSGDRDAARVVHTSAMWLGRGIAQLIDLLDPELVILGTLAVHAGDLFLPDVQRVVQRETIGGSGACRIVAAGLGERIGDVAALSAAIHRYDELRPAAHRE